MIYEFSKILKENDERWLRYGDKLYMENSRRMGHSLFILAIHQLCFFSFSKLLGHAYAEPYWTILLYSNLLNFFIFMLSSLYFFKYVNKSEDAEVHRKYYNLNFLSVYIFWAMIHGVFCIPTLTNLNSVIIFTIIGSGLFYNPLRKWTLLLCFHSLFFTVFINILPKAAGFDLNNILVLWALSIFCPVMCHLIFKVRTNDFAQKKLIEQQKVSLEENYRELNEANLLLINNNADLASYVHTVSHDLRAPLRTINMFSTLLTKKAERKLNEEEVEYLSFIREESKKMNNMLSDLLKFSTLESNQLEFSAVDMVKVLEEIILTLNYDIKAKRAELDLIVPEQNFFVQGQKSMLKLLFQNLIQNALKFSRTDIKPKIKIEVNLKEDSVLIKVEDNGIGIPKESLKDIFILFKRLKTKQDHQGTGIGLATCKKIVNLHRGNIWVESELGSGSVFNCSLPLNQENICSESVLLIQEEV